MKGIILAGGTGSRLGPLTASVCKQLLPVYDKPLIYYPLTLLLSAKIREILVIVTPQDYKHFQRLLQDGSQWGISITYALQPKPEGIAQALILGDSFIGGEPVALILGDNLFHGTHLVDILAHGTSLTEGALLLAYEVDDPNRYGVVEMDALGNPWRLVEKPQHTTSRLAITGLYFYDGQAPALAHTLTKSARQEYEITDLNALYLQQGTLQVHVLERGFAWLDTGTPETLLQAALYVHTLQNRQGVKIGCVEEEAYRQGFISQGELRLLAEAVCHNAYGQYLLRLADYPASCSAGYHNACC